eukprot:TRINITY_DN5291_c0_g1_i1.p1 TRINITY_DN5291_c0_g1~~TRINITY_DN5291_c0_g1_i1.p1  ORF type:complete len:671 (+),score=169.05 TRINITY_DN5291_c0_g1_i1:128-2140(+)
MICGRDVDDLFSYEAVRRVKIRDRRLGAVQYVSTIGVILYIVLYVMLYGQGFRKAMSVTGEATLESTHSIIAFNVYMLDTFCESDQQLSQTFLNSFWTQNAGAWGRRRRSSALQDPPSSGPAPSGPSGGPATPAPAGPGAGPSTPAPNNPPGTPAPGPNSPPGTTPAPGPSSPPDAPAPGSGGQGTPAPNSPPGPADTPPPGPADTPPPPQQTPGPPDTPPPQQQPTPGPPDTPSDTPGPTPVPPPITPQVPPTAAPTPVPVTLSPTAGPVVVSTPVPPRSAPGPPPDGTPSQSAQVPTNQGETEINASVAWDTMTKIDGWHKLPCLFTPTQLVTVAMPPSTVFVATKRNTTLMSWPTESPCMPYDSSCSATMSLRSVLYPAYATFQTFTIRHALHTNQRAVKADATSLLNTGSIHWGWNGEDVDGLGNSTTAKQVLERGFTVGDLLYLAGEQGLVKDSVSGHYQPDITHRNEGGVLLVNLKYTNHKRWDMPWADDTTVKWEMSVTLLSTSYEYAHPPAPGESLLQGTTWVRTLILADENGWLVSCVQEFDLTTYDTAVAILNLTAAMTLLAAVTLVIDFAATNLMPDKVLYNRLMVQTSKDMSDVRDEQKKRVAEGDAASDEPPKQVFVHEVSAEIHRDVVAEMSHKMAELQARLGQIEARVAQAEVSP